MTVVPYVKIAKGRADRSLLIFEFDEFEEPIVMLDS